MIFILRNIRRIFSDDGRGDREFDKQVERLRIARQGLLEATEGLKHSAEILADEIKLRTP